MRNDRDENVEGGGQASTFSPSTRRPFVRPFDQPGVEKFHAAFSLESRQLPRRPAAGMPA